MRKITSSPGRGRETAITRTQGPWWMSRCVSEPPRRAQNGPLQLIADFTYYDAAYWILVGLLLGLFSAAIGLTVIWLSGYYGWRWGVAAGLAWIGLAAMFFIADLVLD